VFHRFAQVELDLATIIESTTPSVVISDIDGVAPKSNLS